MDIANDNKNAAKVIRAEEHREIADQFCGKLTVLPNGAVVAHGFVQNVGHAHSQFEETYFVLEGNLRMALQDSSTEEISEILLKKFDAVKIPPGTGHKVIGGSSDNSIMVTCDPHFFSGDEVRMEKLEAKYQSDQALAASLPGSNREVMQKLIQMKTLIDDFTTYMRHLDDFKCGSSEYMQDWRKLYVTSRFIDGGEKLSKNVTKMQEKSLNGSLDLSIIRGEVREYFEAFFRALKLGDIVHDAQSSDGLYDTGSFDGKRKNKHEVIAVLAQRIDGDWAERIRAVVSVN